MSAAIQDIPLDQITPHPANRRVGGFRKEPMDQLAESIRQVGVIQAATVRPFGDGYQLVAGERRWRASGQAGLATLPCIVKELTDHEALQIQLHENLIRDDLHPLDEAETYALLQESGATIEGIAADVGRSPSYVYQRLRLRSLTPAARDLFVAGAMPTAVALLVARLSDEQQAEIINEWYAQGDEDQYPTARDVDNYIQRRIMMELKGVAWKMDDEALVPEAGSCKLCPKRTGFAPLLFPELGKKDACTDRGCFEAKASAMVARKREELKGQAHIEVAKGCYSQDKGILNSHEWAECKKSDEGAVKVLVAQGSEAGKLLWGKPKKASAVSGGSSGAAVKDDEKEARKREKKLLKAREEASTRIYRATVAAAASTFKPLKSGSKDARLWKIIIQQAWERLDYGTKKTVCDLEAWDISVLGPDSAFRKAVDRMSGEHVQALILDFSLAYFTRSDPYGYGPAPRLVAAAEIFSIDIAEILAQVCASSGFTLEELNPPRPNYAVDDESEEGEEGEDA